MFKAFRKDLFAAVSAVIFASFTMGCASELTDEDIALLEAEGDVQTKSSAIINGNTLTANSMNVAVWHWSHTLNNWFPRPCSGTILRRTSTQTIVLTARHCVTRDDHASNISLIDAALLATSQLRLTTVLNPGTRTSAQTVAPTGYTPSSIVDFRAVATSTVNSSAHDAVILYVNSVLPVVNVPTPSHGRTGLIGLHRGPLAELLGMSQRAFGYGRNLEGTVAQREDDYWSGGAGTLRTAQGLVIDLVQPSSYNANNYRTGIYGYMNNPDGGDGAVINGDSGGGSFIRYNTAPAVTLWTVLSGVHSSAWLETPIPSYQGVNAAVSTMSDWIQDKLVWLSLSPASYPDKRVYFSSVADGGIAKWNTSTNNAGLYYNGKLKQIRQASSTGISNLCLEDTGTGSTQMKLKACDSGKATQKWSMLSDYRIRNDSSLECLQRINVGYVVGGSCTVDPTIQFVWSTVP